MNFDKLLLNLVAINYFFSIFLIRRAFADTTGKIFTIIHANLISFETSIHLEELLTKQRNSSNELQLIFISSNDTGGSQSYITTALEKNAASAPPPTIDNDMRDYVKKHLIVSKSAKACVPSQLDPDQSKLRLVASNNCGNGMFDDCS